MQKILLKLPFTEVFDGWKLRFHFKCQFFLKISDFINYVKEQKWWLCKNMSFQFFYQRSSVQLICQVEIWPKKFKKWGFNDTPNGMGIQNLKWNYVGFKTGFCFHWRWFWYSERYFVSNVTKKQSCVQKFDKKFMYYEESGSEVAWIILSAPCSRIWYSELFFRPKMNKIWFQIKPQVFFFIL